MSARTSTAIVVGMILGYISGVLLGNAGYAAFIVLAFCGIVSPLIVYPIADRTAVWVSMVPNVIMVATTAVVEWLKAGNARPFQWLAVVLWAVFMAWFSLLVSMPFYLIRNRVKKVKRYPAAEGILNPGITTH